MCSSDLAKVRGVIRRHAADVHLYVVARSKLNDLSARGVEELHAVAANSVDAGETRCDAGFVSHVQLQQHGGQGFNRQGIRKQSRI